MLFIIDMFNVFNHIPRTMSKLHKNIMPVSANGSWLYTQDEKKYLDFTSGIGALSTGHSHPYIIDKVKQQLPKLVHIQQQIFGSHPPQIELTQKLLKIMPHKGLNNFFYVNSGSEATDNAIKIARKYTGRQNILALNKGFHGRSLAALSVTSSNVTSRLNGLSLSPGVFFFNDKTDLDRILEFQSSPLDVCAIIVEPVQGEGGVNSIPKHLLQHIQQICRDNGILLIADEVQCGSGRTGTWWNVEQKNINPDIMTFGKGIASGYPFAGLVSSGEIMNSIGESYLGGTYGGNAICSVAASATIDVFNNENLLSNAEEMGLYIKNNIETIHTIKQVRQYGLMIAIEFSFSNESEKVMKIVDLLRDEGILVLLCGHKSQYIRILPPLNVSLKDVDIFLTKFHKIVGNI